MSKFYSLTAINKKNATYNVIFGERSNGKTYAALKQGVTDYYKNGGQMAYVRRWKEDITGRRASRLFAALCENGEIQKITTMSLRAFIIGRVNGTYAIMMKKVSLFIQTRILFVSRLRFPMVNMINQHHSSILI